MLGIHRPSFFVRRDGASSGRLLASVPRLWPWAFGGDGVIAAIARHEFLAPLALTVIGWTVLAWRYPVTRLIDLPAFWFGAVKPHYRLIPDTLALGLVWLGYLWGYLWLRNARTRARAAMIGLGLSLAVASLANVLLYPVGARDVFHYLMTLDIYVKHHANPYLVVYASLPQDIFARYGFVFDAPLGYGPGWLFLSLLPAPLAGFESVLRTLLVYKGYNLLLVLGTAWVIWEYRGRGKAGLIGAYLFALNPLVLFEGVGNGHNDVLGALFLVLAVVALQRRSWLSLPFLAVATAVKFYTAPIALVFAVVMLRRRWPLSRMILSGAAALAVVALMAAPFWDGGAMLAGLRTGSQEYMRGLYSASVLSLAREAATELGLASAGTVEMVSGLTLAALTLGVALLGRRRTDAAPTVGIVLAGAMLLATNFLPWYLLTLVAVIALERGEGSLGYLFPGTLLGLLYYFFSIGSWWRMPSRPLLVHLVEACVITVPLIVFIVTRGRSLSADAAPAVAVPEGYRA
ncbi:MAG: glycosyltransferase 87 family protein [Anaerolineae bacterium]